MKETLESKRSEMESLVALAKTEERELSKDEQIKFDSLEVEVRELEAKLEAEEKEAERKAKEAAEEAERKAKEEKEAIERKAQAEAERAAKEQEEALAVERKANQEKIAELERKLADEAEAKEALQKEIKERKLEENMSKEKNLLFEEVRSQLASGAQGGSAITVERAAVDGDTSVMGQVIPKGVKPLDILGYEPLWKQMGVDYMPGAKGTYTLPFQSPIIGAKLAELAAITKDVVTPDGTLVTPNRYSVQKEFTLETLASATDEFLNKTLGDMVKGCDRAISRDVFAKAEAGATEVAAATAVTKDNFDLLMAGAEIEYSGAFISHRSQFFAAKGVVIDAGSGRFLIERMSNDTLGKGQTYEGVDYWYSNLFDQNTAGADATNRIVYGDISRIHVADYGMLEVILDKYTKAGEGKVIVTVNKIADVALLNPGAFTKTAVIV